MRPVARLAAAGSLACGLTAVFGLSPAPAQQVDPSSGAIQDQPLPPPPDTNESRVLGTGAMGNGSVASPAAPPPPEAPATAAPATGASAEWVQGKQAQLTVLDKIYGSTTKLAATVGTPFTVRFLTIDVLACWTRPPSLPPDAAAFLQVNDTHAPPGAPPEFRGWVFEAEPALSGMNDPATDISVNGCS